MIQKIKIDWRNCYGIKELNQEFKFTPGKQIHLIYAPNGSMKTSFAKTMRYLSGQSKEKPCDKLHDKDKSSFILKVKMRYSVLSNKMMQTLSLAYLSV